MLKQLASYIGKYKKFAILTPILVCLEVGCEVVIPLIMAGLIDKGIEGNAGAGDLKAIFIYGGLLLVFCALSALIGIATGRASALTSAGFSKNLRQGIFYKVQTFSFSNIDKFTTSSLVTRLTSDVTHVQNALVTILRSLVRSPINMAISLVVVMGIKPELAMVFIFCTPILLTGLILIRAKVHPLFRTMFTYYDKLNNVVQENVRGIRVVKGFVREDHERKKFAKVSGDIRDRFSKAERIMALNGPLMSTCMHVCTLVVVWLGAKIIVASGGSELTTGNLTSVISYSMNILMSLMMVSMLFIQMTMARAAGERICEVLNEVPDIANCDDSVTEVPDGSIRFENVSFSYSGRKSQMALKNVNIEIKSGETIGILGGTGSAKSTLVQLIPRLYDPSEGAVYVGGINVKDYDMAALRDKVAMVLQKNILFSGSVAENLRWGNENATDEEIEHICQLAQADSFIKEMPFGYQTMLEQGGTNLSGGQKQRLCIARALLKKPRILILDDSTSAVDTRTDAHIRAAFKEVIPGTTKLIIAQRISSVQDADRIIVMEKGEIVGFGTHEELMATNEIYSDIYNTQTNGGDFDAE